MADVRQRSRRPPAGSDPGTLVAIPRPHRAPLRLVHFDERKVEEHDVTDVHACRPWLERPGVTWIDLIGPDEAQLQALGSLLGLHPLAVSDVAHPPQRPVFEPYTSSDFLLLHTVREKSLRMEQVSLFVGDRWVLTVQDEPPDVFAPVRERLREGIGNLRAKSAPYLLAALVAVLIDRCFPVVEELQAHLERLEDEVLRLQGRGVFARIQSLRRKLLALRRGFQPMRDALHQAARDPSQRFDEETRLHLRESEGDLEQLLEMVEAGLAGASSLGEQLISLVGFRTNEIINFLTVMSTIFLPLTFLTGVWGMNFDPKVAGNMPELEWPYGYLMALGVMLACAIGMLLLFRSRGWLVNPPRETEPAPKILGWERAPRRRKLVARRQ